MHELFQPILRESGTTYHAALVALLLSFALTQALAGVYLWTYRGLSYSRSFVQTLALVSLVACMVMLAIGNSLAAGIGVAGGLSIVRFRTSLRDPRDMLFVFAAVAAGIASGLQAYAAAVLGTGVFCLAAIGLTFSDFGVRQELDGLIRFSAPSSPEAAEAVAKALKAHCHQFVLVTLRPASQGEMMEHAYQVSLPAPEMRTQLVDALQRIEGVTDVSLLLQEPTLEL